MRCRRTYVLNKIKVDGKYNMTYRLNTKEALLFSAMVFRHKSFKRPTGFVVAGSSPFNLIIDYSCSVYSVFFD